MIMAEAVKKGVKAEKPKIDDKAAAVRAPSSVEKAGEKAVTTKVETAKAEPVKEASPEIKTELSKAEAKKEADPGKEFVDGIMTEMGLKGGSKKRLIKKLAEQFNFDKQKVIFKLKRALITERYAAAHETKP